MLALESSIAEADGLISTFNSLLLIAEAETGAHRDTLELMDLSEVIHDIADLYEPVAEDRGVTLRFVAPSRVSVRGNRSLLARAAANLVENALKYTPQGGSVTVATGINRDDRPTFSVRDTGPGIPKPTANACSTASCVSNARATRRVRDWPKSRRRRRAHARGDDRA